MRFLRAAFRDLAMFLNDLSSRGYSATPRALKHICRVLGPGFNVFPIVSGIYNKTKILFDVKCSTKYHAIPFNNVLKVTGGQTKFNLEHTIYPTNYV